MLYKLFENILENKDVYTSANDGTRFEDKLRSRLRTNFSEFKKNDIFNLEGIAKKTAEKKYKELKEKILSKSSVEIVENPFGKIDNSFIFQPYGSQNFPDFLIFTNGFVIPVEAKFSTNEKEGSNKPTENSKPMWNSNLPKANALYIYGIAGLNITFFIGSDVLCQETREKLLGFWDRLIEGDFGKIFIEEIKMSENPFGFYPYIRKAYDQKLTASTYTYKTKEGDIKVGIESFFSDGSKQREQNLIIFLKNIEDKK
ncbi:hypothetical protein [[Acholeplasma] multilocale]|uniref:hypothetical protein n=1 Tax=[Acholeplasma] multilocale TaxID=264638 RepID=UPI00047C8853|nr:hypothetical protein [[Acholeplasma] multilocale]